MEIKLSEATEGTLPPYSAMRERCAMSWLQSQSQTRLDAIHCGGGAREADGDAARAPQPSCTALCVWGGGRDRPRHVPVLGSDSVPAPMGTSGQTWDMCRVYNDPYGSQ